MKKQLFLVFIVIFTVSHVMPMEKKEEVFFEKLAEVRNAMNRLCKEAQKKEVSHLDISRHLEYLEKKVAALKREEDQK